MTVPWRGQSRLGRRCAPDSRGPPSCGAGARSQRRAEWQQRASMVSMAGSRVRRDGSNDAIDRLALPEGMRQRLAQCMKGPVHGCPCWVRRGESTNDADRVQYKDRIAGSRRALVFTIPVSALVLRSNPERVSLVYRNDDGVNASTDSTVFRVDGQDPIACSPDRPAKSGAKSSPHFSRISPHIARKCSDRQ